MDPFSILGVVVSVVQAFLNHLRKLFRSQPNPPPSQAERMDEWRRLEARIYGIVARTPPKNPFDSSPMVVVEGYSISDWLATVVIHCSSAEYEAQLRRVIKASGVLSGGDIKFTLEKANGQAPPNGVRLVGGDPPLKDEGSHKKKPQPQSKCTSNDPPV
jgi:hypothetical protein